MHARAGVGARVGSESSMRTLSLRAAVQADGSSSFISCHAVLALMNCGNICSVTVHSEGGHTSAGTPLHTRSRMRTK